MAPQIGVSWEYRNGNFEQILYGIDATSDRSAHAVADEIARRAQGYVPVRTGALRDSIHVEQNGLADYTVVVDEPYAGYVEFGTRYMNPRPFLGPAAADVDAAMFALEWVPLLGDFHE